MRRRRTKANANRPAPNSASVAGSGTPPPPPPPPPPLLLLPLPLANPVATAPDSPAQVVGPLAQTKICDAARFPSALAMSTCAALAQVPPVSVRSKEIFVLE